MEEKIKAAQAAEEKTQKKKPVSRTKKTADGAVGGAEPEGQPRKAPARKPRPASVKKQGTEKNAVSGDSVGGSSSAVQNEADAKAVAANTQDAPKPATTRKRPAARKKAAGGDVPMPEDGEKAAQKSVPDTKGNSAAEPGAASDTAPKAASRSRGRGAAKAATATAGNTAERSQGTETAMSGERLHSGDGQVSQAKKEGTGKTQPRNPKTAREASAGMNSEAAIRNDRSDGENVPRKDAASGPIAAKGDTANRTTTAGTGTGDAGPNSDGEAGGEQRPPSANRRRRRGGRGRGGHPKPEEAVNAGGGTPAGNDDGHEQTEESNKQQSDAAPAQKSEATQSQPQPGGASKSRSRRKKKHPQGVEGDTAQDATAENRVTPPVNKQAKKDAAPRPAKQQDGRQRKSENNRDHQERSPEHTAKPAQHGKGQDVNKELIVNVTPAEITIALLEDKQLVELNKEKCRTGFAVGDIYLGKVRKIMPGLNAAFVSIGHEKDAFIHYLDLGPQFTTLHKLTGQLTSNKKTQKFDALKLDQPINKKGKISNFLSSGQPILVQIAKEAISTKGPRLTSDFSLAGRHVVLIPFSNKVNVSQKIRSNEEKKRLKKIIDGVLPRNYGVIIRTAAQGKSQTDLENDITSLVARWESALEATRNAPPPPQLLLSEMNRTTTIIRDLLNGSFSSIVADDKSIYEEIKEYIKTIAPEKEKIVKLYKGRVPIFDNFDISKQIKGLFAKYVSLRKGAYLIVEHTEAMHVVDVNSGNRAKVADDQEQTAMEVNLAAAAEISRQLRLRDMGGIIVIDFIDLHRSENRNALHNRMTELMSSDRAKHTILPISKFGLMQITRQRVRPEAIAEETEICPACGGTGTITPTANLDEQIENKVAYFVAEHKLKYIKLRVSPYVEAFLKKGFPSIRRQWQRKYNVKINIVTDQSTGLVETKYFDSEDNELV